MQAKKLSWFKPWTKTLEWNPPFAKWFVDGKINASYNTLDVHQNNRAQKPAILWEGEDGETRTVTYQDLFRDVCKFANVLKSLGVKKGDRVTIYLPMIPELSVTMLACSRIGAIHVVVFSGFSTTSLRDRIDDSKSKVIVTADVGFRKGSIIKLQEIVDESIKDLDFVEHVVVLKRINSQSNLLAKHQR
jgi:acetyl-CoA synthetase